MRVDDVIRAVDFMCDGSTTIDASKITAEVSFMCSVTAL